MVLEMCSSKNPLFDLWGSLQLLGGARRSGKVFLCLALSLVLALAITETQLVDACGSPMAAAGTRSRALLLVLCRAALHVVPLEHSVPWDVTAPERVKPSFPVLLRRSPCLVSVPWDVPLGKSLSVRASAFCCLI